MSAELTNNALTFCRLGGFTNLAPSSFELYMAEAQKYEVLANYLLWLSP
ncbi:MAG: hypothetical protein HC865_20050 [Cyanobacteria bacterium RU_5_0]|nr:hypothetical protein [Cyanobacteria bacterium RU_5_0]